MGPTIPVDNLYSALLTFQNFFQVTCDPLSFTCGELGQCEGTLVDLTHTNLEGECIELCVANVDCEWYSFSTEHNSCSLFADCPSVDDNAESTVYGEQKCWQGSKS